MWQSHAALFRAVTCVFLSLEPLKRGLPPGTEAGMDEVCESGSLPPLPRPYPPAFVSCGTPHGQEAFVSAGGVEFRTCLRGVQTRVPLSAWSSKKES